MRFGTLAGVAALVSIVAGTSAAQPTGSTAKADELFNQGRLLLEAGKFKLACVKFQQSLEEADALGTRLNLALCMEKRGKVYTAMLKFEDTAERAKRASEPSSEQVAREHVDQLRPLVPTITIQLAKPVAGATITLIRPGEPDQAVPESGIVQTDPTDPEDASDKITIRVTAPGHVDHSTEPFELAQKAKPVVTIPALAPLSDTGGPEVPPPGKSRRKLIAIGLGVAGAGLIGGSALWARSIRSSAKDACEGPMGRDPCEYTSGELNKMRFGASGMFVAGIAAIGVGAYLFITAPSSSETRERAAVVPTVTPDGPGIVVLGHF